MRNGVVYLSFCLQICVLSVLELANGKALFCLLCLVNRVECLLSSKIQFCTLPLALEDTLIVWFGDVRIFILTLVVFRLGLIWDFQELHWLLLPVTVSKDTFIELIGILMGFLYDLTAHLRHRLI